VLRWRPYTDVGDHRDPALDRLGGLLLAPDRAPETANGHRRALESPSEAPIGGLDGASVEAKNALLAGSFDDGR
jgi:hypothetical protein